MKILIAIFASITLTQATLADNQGPQLPAKLSKTDIAGAIFERPVSSRRPPTAPACSILFYFLLYSTPSPPARTACVIATDALIEKRNLIRFSLAASVC